MPIRLLLFAKWSTSDTLLIFLEPLIIVHMCIKYTSFSSLEHCDSHADGIKRSLSKMRAHMGYGSMVCLKGREKLAARRVCAPFLPVENWGTGKQKDLFKMPQAIYGGAGNWIQISWILSRALTSKASFLTNQVYQTSHQTPICISAYPQICIPLWSWKLVCSLLPHPQRFDKVVKPA